MSSQNDKEIDKLVSNLKLAYTKSPSLTPSLFNQVLDLFKKTNNVTIINNGTSEGDGNGNGNGTGEGNGETTVLIKDKNFIFEQNLPSKEWFITHNLEKYPSVTILDSAKTKIEGQVTYISESEIIVSFNSQFSGTATLN